MEEFWSSKFAAASYIRSIAKLKGQQLKHLAILICGESYQPLVDAEQMITCFRQLPRSEPP